MAIYVGNLSYNVTETYLKTVFTPYGKVKEVQLPTDYETGRIRGFGFVEMEIDAEETAAIEALDGAEYMGRILNIKRAKYRKKYRVSSLGSEHKNNSLSQADKFNK